MRSAIATIANVGKSAVKCNFYIPPAGGCWVDLVSPDEAPDLPKGATINGSASIDYLKARDRSQAREALATFARVDIARVTCEDFSGEPVVSGEDAPAVP